MKYLSITYNILLKIISVTSSLSATQLTVCQCDSFRRRLWLPVDVRTLCIFRGLQIAVTFLTEAWHDGDSVCLRLLRAAGFQVIDRPRPRLRVDTITTNHGGIVVVANPGVSLSKVDLGVKPSTFELLCIRVVSGALSFIAAAIYRPGSTAITTTFFVELSDVLDRLATFVELVLVTGDVNIRLERSTDAETTQFVDMLAAYGLAHCTTSATHSLGGMLDVVALRADMLPLQVDVIDVDLSDHRLLRWAMPLVRPNPVYSSTTCRSWTRMPSVLHFCHPSSVGPSPGQYWILMNSLSSMIAKSPKSQMV